jgi:predicted P-loop ATPase
MAARRAAEERRQRPLDMGLQHQDIGVTVSVPATAAETVAKNNCFHPIKNYLEKLVWDGVERIANFAWRYLGAEDTHYHGGVSRCLFIAAVARIMRRKGGFQLARRSQSNAAARLGLRICEL